MHRRLCSTPRAPLVGARPRAETEDEKCERFVYAETVLAIYHIVEGNIQATHKGFPRGLPPPGLSARAGGWAGASFWIAFLDFVVFLALGGSSSFFSLNLTSNGVRIMSGDPLGPEL